MGVQQCIGSIEGVEVCCMLKVHSIQSCFKWNSTACCRPRVDSALRFMEERSLTICCGFLLVYGLSEIRIVYLALRIEVTLTVIFSVSEVIYSESAMSPGVNCTLYYLKLECKTV